MGSEMKEQTTSEISVEPPRGKKNPLAVRDKQNIVELKSIEQRK